MKSTPKLGAYEIASREIHKYKIEGAVAEVGVYRGYFAEYINYFFPKRKFYMFDTFCGFDKRDINIEQEKHYSEFKVGDCFLDTSELIVMDKMSTPENCLCIKGYFPETASQIKNEKFCFVHLDTDLYLPIKNGLEFFYPRLSHGGYIFIHDFNGSAKGVREAVKEFCETNNIGYVCLPDSVVKGTVVITK